MPSSKEIKDFIILHEALYPNEGGGGGGSLDLTTIPDGEILIDDGDILGSISFADLAAQIPQNYKIVANKTELFAIPSDERQEGTIAYLQDSFSAWQLVGGITNSNWTFHTQYQNPGWVAAADYSFFQLHVHTDGDDLNAGTSAASPFKTIERALEYMPKFLDAKYYMIYLGPGIFPSPTKPFQFVTNFTSIYIVGHTETGYDSYSDINYSLVSGRRVRGRRAYDTTTLPDWEDGKYFSGTVAVFPDFEGNDLKYPQYFIPLLESASGTGYIEQILAVDPTNSSRIFPYLSYITYDPGTYNCGLDIQIFYRYYTGTPVVLNGLRIIPSPYDPSVWRNCSFQGVVAEGNMITSDCEHKELVFLNGNLSCFGEKTVVEGLLCNNLSIEGTSVDRFGYSQINSSVSIKNSSVNLMNLFDLVNANININNSVCHELRRLNWVGNPTNQGILIQNRSNVTCTVEGGDPATGSFAGSINVPVFSIHNQSVVKGITDVSDYLSNTANPGQDIDLGAAGLISYSDLPRSDLSMGDYSEICKAS